MIAGHHLGILRTRLPLALLVALATLVACGEEPAKKPVTGKDVADAAADSGEDSGGADTTDGGSVDSAGGDSEDVASDGSDEDTGVDASIDTVVDAGPECGANADCAGKVTVLACESAACVDGACKAVLIPGKCCTEAHCDDGKECTADACDTNKFACLHTPVPNCCSGKTTLLKAGFEQAVGDLTILDGATNGDTTWKMSAKRARVGAQSLYFGNACNTYDTTMTPDDGCEPGAGAAPVSTVLQTKALQLPKDKSTQLQFWLWLETEPSYADTLPKGNCTGGCPVGASCVSVNGASQCLPEKDVLTVVVTPDGGAPIKVFDATTINKSTGKDWKHIVIDLDAFQGLGVKVAWQFNTVTGFKNNFEGIYLDEIILDTVCAIEGTLCAADKPCLDDGSVCTDDACTFYANTPGKGFCFHDANPACCLTSANCDDGKPCTVDVCSNGACQYNPDAANPSCCKPSIEQTFDFDSGVLDAWKQQASNSSDVKWRIDPKGGLKGSQTLYFGDASFASYADPSLPKGQGPAGTICMPPQKLKIGTIYNLVSFQLNLETEWSYLPKGTYKNPPLPGQPKFDHLSVGVLQDGVPGAKIEPLWSSDTVMGTTNGEWVEITLALDAWQGKTVAVCFTFDAGDDQVNDRAGPRIDEVLLRIACTKPDCFLDVDCKELSCGACEAPLCTAGTCGCAKIPGCCSKAADCDDQNACTADSCLSGTCKHQPLPDCCNVDKECSSDDVCKAASCDVASHTCKLTDLVGCCKADDDCKTAKLCVTTACEVASGKCIETKVTGCCTADLDCDDGKVCTTDLCIDLACQYKPSGASGCD